MRIEAIFPSYQFRIPQQTENPVQGKMPEAVDTVPPVVVNISPEGWAAYQSTTEPAQNPAAQTETTQRNGLPNTFQLTFKGGQSGGGTNNKIADVFETHECLTCKSRKYQDSSSDPSVSFQAPTHISPGQAGAAVASHESEHVAHEQAKAEREDRKIVSQTVSLSTSICPECGRIYISGGVTRTITANKQDNSPEIPEAAT